MPPFFLKVFLHYALRPVYPLPGRFLCFLLEAVEKEHEASLIEAAKNARLLNPYLKKPVNPP